MDVRFSAALMDGVTAEALPVQLRLGRDGLELESSAGESLTRWPLAGLERVPHVQGAIHLRHRDHPGALLSSEDPSLGAALGSLGFSSGLSRRRVLSMAAYGAATAALVAIFVNQLPALTRAVSQRVPLSVEAELGASLTTLLAEHACEGPGSRGALERLASRLRLESDPSPELRRIELVNLSVANAFTLPGGTLVLTRGLIEEAQGPDEVAGVMAHELEHVARRHVMTRLVRSTLLTTGWQLTLGDFSGLLAIDPATLLELASLEFSREDEREADAGALARLRHADISSAGFAAFFERLENASGDIPEWLSSHPASALRREAARAVPPGAASPALTDAEWTRLRGACVGPADELGWGDLVGG